MSNFFLNIFLIKKYFYKNKPTRNHVPCSVILGPRGYLLEMD